MKAGKMNQTEAKYAGMLEARKQAGEISYYCFDGINLRIGENCHYWPDFLVMLADGSLECHEVKGGYMTDDSLVKIKVAAEKYPFQFRMFKYEKKQWTERTF